MVLNRKRQNNIKPISEPKFGIFLMKYEGQGQTAVFKQIVISILKISLRVRPFKRTLGLTAYMFFKTSNFE